MKVACLCPTFSRKTCPENAVALFLRQTHPERRLFVLSDGGVFEEDLSHDLYKVRAVDTRFPSLPSKYNALLEWALEDYDPDLVMVWEDDDIFLPNHIQSYVEYFTDNPDIVAARLEYAFVYNPEEKRVIVEKVTDNFHGTLAFRPQGKDKKEIKWIETDIAAYDIEFIHWLTRNYKCGYVPGVPTYYLRYPCFETINAEIFANGLYDHTWYQRYGNHFGRSCCIQKVRLQPKIDPETEYLLTTFWSTGLSDYLYLMFSKTGVNMMGHAWRTK